MEEDRELKYVCKVCFRGFSSGKVLGGHMRGHMGKTKLGFEVNDNSGYGLRENPRKSSKFNTNRFCDVCGKDFDSPRALFGHMRHCPRNGRKSIHCEECGKWFLSARALGSHLKIHNENLVSSSRFNGLLVDSLSSDSENLVRRKRSRRVKSSSSLTSFNGSYTVCESTEEIEEAARCLIMISQSLSNWDEFNFESTGEYFETKEDLHFNLVDESDLVGSKKSGKFSVSQDSEMFDDQFSLKKGDFQCGICYKTFLTHQALGGHQTSHRKQKNCVLMEMAYDYMPEISENSMDEKISENSMDEKIDRIVKIFKCPICFKVFSSGQALGGHKRAHASKAACEIEDQTHQVKEELSDIVSLFDLNIAVKVREDDVGLESLSSCI